MKQHRVFFLIPLFLGILILGLTVITGFALARFIQQGNSLLKQETISPPDQSPQAILATITPSPVIYPTSPNIVLISEIQAGITGNNNYEFIELYNPGMDPVDLRGWSLWYRLPTNNQDLFVHRWTDQALVPPHGHYLLVRQEIDLGIAADARFSQAINLPTGGLQLRNMGGDVIDSVSWGEASQGFVEKSPAPALKYGISLERLPGSGLGNATDTNQNALDFRLNATPEPQNTGSSPTPLQDRRLEISLEVPRVVEPGSQFDLSLTVENHTGQAMKNVIVTLPIPGELTFENIDSTTVSSNLWRIEENIVYWEIELLKDQEQQQVSILLSVPYTYLTMLISNYYVKADDLPMETFGGPIWIKVEGGRIPIAMARTLLDSELTIEGIATMYTGGFFAGSGNVKFYLEDETGGIQVQVFGGQGSVNIKIGTPVRVRGTISVYQGSLEIVPILVPDDIEKLDIPVEPSSPLPVSIQQATTDIETIPGRLIQVEGRVLRVEEFTYNYEIDLAEEVTNSKQPFSALTLYIDKQTEVLVEQIEVGHIYKAVGIIEYRNGKSQLYPRQQSDLQRIYPPNLRLEAEAPAVVAEGEPIQYIINIYNDTDIRLTNVELQAEIPAGVTLEDNPDMANQTGRFLTWKIAELAPGGGNEAVTFTVIVNDPSTEQVIFNSLQASAAEWREVVSGPVLRTFTGSHVPIWAIQGNGFRSPYLFNYLTTGGIVTGVFPGLGGFFVQSTLSDDDHLSSDGIFISVNNLEVPVILGDYVEISGTVRELNGQTTLLIDHSRAIQTISQGNPLPEPFELDPPQTSSQAAIYYEALEGCLVRVSEPARAVSPTSRYGEFVVIRSYHDQNRLYQGQDNGIAIMVDDGDSITHQDRSTIANAVSTGDWVSNLIGPLAYTYGQYKIEPIAILEIQPGNFQPQPLPPMASDEFSIMTWNVENLFDPFDPHPSDPPRPSLSEYQRNLTKIAETFLETGAPTIIALQEVENLGILEDLINHELLREYEYEAVLIEGYDSRGIDVGYLVRGDQADILDIQQRDAPEGITSRPPLILKVEIVTGQQEKLVIYIINNHFTSMSGGVEATEPRRLEQANWNVQLLSEIISQDPQAFVAILGDLNSYFESAPIQTLRNAGLQHVIDVLPPTERYTYIYQGESQVLDHILITSSLMDYLRKVTIYHANADYPLPLPGDQSSIHESDHDPVIITFGLR
jgi:uncharacterized repeat protein (TIGR01451 family)